MTFSEKNIEIQPEILKRHKGGEFAKPITLDASAFTNGVCKAGTPINADGEIAETTEGENSAPDTNDAIGILLNDVYSSNPNGSLLYANAVINVAVAEDWADVEYDDALIAQLSHLVFE